MSNDEQHKQDTSRAWFVVTEPGNDEQFLPGAGGASQEPAPTAVMPPEKNLPLAERREEEHGDEGGAELAWELSQPPERVKQPGDLAQLPDRRVATGEVASPLEDARTPEPISDPRQALDAPERAPIPVAELLRQRTPIAQVPGRVNSGTQASADEHLSLPATRTSDFGFRQSQLIRMGSNDVMASFAHVGLVVTVRTPRRLRLGQVTVIKETRTVLGRGRVGCFVDDPEVADFHAVITCQQMNDSSGFCLHTCESAPTTLNGEKPGAIVRLRSGDHIGLGDTELIFLEVPLHNGGAV